MTYLVVFRQHISGTPPSLSSEDLALVNKALEKSENIDNTNSDPKVVVNIHILRRWS